MTNGKALTQAEILQALYNNSHQQGMGFLDPRGEKQITLEDAEEILKNTKTTYFDYLYGRVLKINVANDGLNFRLYDRDNGEGAGARAIEAAMKRKEDGNARRGY